jgi:hypothetical protein
MITVNEGETIDFTFTDNTLIVEANNPVNAGTLSALQTTVVWWDDAEGEMHPYYERSSFAGYYATASDLGTSSSRYSSYFDKPKNGKKSIAVGGTNTAKLHLKVTLTKTAKLTFWYANKRPGSTGTTFSINGTTQRTWSTDVDWSKDEYDLAAGVNDMVWEKKNGYYHDSYYNYYDYYYLTLDDILIYYTE